MEGSEVRRIVTSGRVMLLLALLSVCFSIQGRAQAGSQTPEKISVDWNTVMERNKTAATLQVVVNPQLRRGASIHDSSFAALQSLGADYVRYVPWNPYPRLAVPELQPPANGHTFWDFNLIDPMTEDFFAATEGHTRILNFSTMPAWLFRTDRPVTYPDDPNAVDWSYTQGKILRDPSCKELADYYARLVAWYTRGGFTDEYGVRHNSGHHDKIDYWEVFNEIDIEHQPTPQQYTQEYDAVVGAIHAVDPSIRFVGLALAYPGRNPEMFEYFLNPSNHKPGIPLDMISYHFYASPTVGQTPNEWQYTFFDQAESLFTAIRYIEQIRKRLSPSTRTTIDEIGSILPTDWHPDDPYAEGPAIPPIYWNASGSLYAYVYMESAKLGIDVAGESQLVGYPSQFPSVTMIDWKTGKPNARFEVLRLLHDHVHPGAEFVKIDSVSNDVGMLAFTDKNRKALMLVNKRNRIIAVRLPDALVHGRQFVIDEAHTDAAAAPEVVTDPVLKLAPFSVSVVTEQ